MERRTKREESLKNLNKVEIMNLITSLLPELHQGSKILLKGDFGTGKTTFTQMLVGALHPQSKVTSPTFGIMHIYDDSSGNIPVAHLDLCRIKHIDELIHIGFDEVENKVISVIEWPELLEKTIGDAITIHITLGDQEDTRNITVYRLYNDDH